MGDGNCSFSHRRTRTPDVQNASCVSFRKPLVAVRRQIVRSHSCKTSLQWQSYPPRPTGLYCCIRCLVCDCRRWSWRRARTGCLPASSTSKLRAHNDRGGVCGAPCKMISLGVGGKEEGVGVRINGRVTFLLSCVNLFHQGGEEGGGASILSPEKACFLRNRGKKMVDVSLGAVVMSVDAISACKNI